MLWGMPEHLDGHQRMQALDRIAGRQLGLVTADQLHGIGFGRAGRECALESRRLHPVRKGVYRLPGVVPTWETAVLAAALAAGPEAVASHLSAAHLWRLFDGPEIAGARAAIHVTAPGQHRLSGVRLHRGSLDSRERARHRSVPITTPARTLFDLASIVSADQLGRCTDDALEAPASEPRGVTASLRAACRRRPSPTAAPALRVGGSGAWIRPGSQ